MQEGKEGAPEDRTWPYFALLFAYLASLLLAAVCLPSLDGVPANVYRFGLYAGTSAIYWARILMARRRKDTDRGYIFYIVLMLSMPFLAWPLQEWLWW